jgi:hypothetical protein
MKTGVASSSGVFYEARLPPYEAHFVLANFARQASKYMKRTFGA